MTGGTYRPISRTMVIKATVVLVGPQGDANIGAAARAMKNFGFSDLRLVAPAPHLTDEALSWAVDAKDILERASVHATLDEALNDFPFSAAFTRRLGRTRRRHLPLSDAAPLLASKAEAGGTALVFGREDAGLTNDEIGRCDTVIEIPTSSDLPSINLAQSVILAAYEISKGFTAKHSAHEGKQVEESFLPKEEVMPILQKMDEILLTLGYENAPDRPLRAKILDQFEKLFGRAGLTQRDLAMFEGLISRIKSKTE